MGLYSGPFHFSERLGGLLLEGAYSRGGLYTELFSTRAIFSENFSSIHSVLGSPLEHNNKNKNNNKDKKKMKQTCLPIWILKPLQVFQKTPKNPELTPCGFNTWEDVTKCSPFLRKMIKNFSLLYIVKHPVQCVSLFKNLWRFKIQIIRTKRYFLKIRVFKKTQSDNGIHW